MEEQCSSGDVIVQILKVAGVEHVFGIISIHNIPIYDAIARQGGIRTITNRSEPGAVNMADGYAKAAGRLGVVITSTGSGAGNAAGSLIEAQIAEMWGAGVLTSQAGRGAIPEDHSQCIGNFAYNSAIRDFITSCDVLLAG